MPGSDSLGGSEEAAPDDPKGLTFIRVAAWIWLRILSMSFILCRMSCFSSGISASRMSWFAVDALSLRYRDALPIR